MLSEWFQANWLKMAPTPKQIFVVNGKPVVAAFHVDPIHVHTQIIEFDINTQKSEILWVSFRSVHRIPVLVSDKKGNLLCAMADGKGMRIASKKCGLERFPYSMYIIYALVVLFFRLCHWGDMQKFSFSSTHADNIKMNTFYICRSYVEWVLHWKQGKKWIKRWGTQTTNRAGGWDWTS